MYYTYEHTGKEIEKKKEIISFHNNKVLFFVDKQLKDIMCIYVWVIPFYFLISTFLSHEYKPLRPVVFSLCRLSSIFQTFTTILIQVFNPQSHFTMDVSCFFSLSLRLHIEFHSLRICIKIYQYPFSSNL